MCRGVINGKAGKHLPYMNFETTVILYSFCLVDIHFITSFLLISHFIKFLVVNSPYIMFLLGKQSFYKVIVW